MSIRRRTIDPGPRVRQPSMLRGDSLGGVAGRGSGRRTGGLLSLADAA